MNAASRKPRMRGETTSTAMMRRHRRRSGVKPNTGACSSSAEMPIPYGDRRRDSLPSRREHLVEHLGRLARDAVGFAAPVTEPGELDTGGSVAPIAQQIQFKQAVGLGPLAKPWPLPGTVRAPSPAQSPPPTGASNTGQAYDPARIGRLSCITGRLGPWRWFGLEPLDQT
jgi:hypothetical protein